MSDLIQEYRGFEIRKHVDGSFVAYKGDMTYCKTNTAWSAIVYIDELLSP